MGKRVMAAFCAGLLFLLSSDAASQARQSRIQRAIDQAMARLQGSVVVVDVESGRVVASHRLDAAARRPAAPGSAIKPFTLLALLQSGIVRPETTIVCRKDARIADAISLARTSIRRNRWMQSPRSPIPATPFSFKWPNVCR